ncbi:MAG: error-prone DNA polymerase [Pirellulales bacterium]
MDYVELHCKTNFSFLEGASHADELIEQAANYGYRGLAVTDRNTLAGVVRGHTAARDWNKEAAGKLQYIVGCELHPIDGPPLVVWPTDRLAYGRLCRLLSIGRLRCEKGACRITWDDIAKYSEGMLAGLLLRFPNEDGMTQALHRHAMDEAFEETNWEDQGSLIGSEEFVSEKGDDEATSPLELFPSTGQHAWPSLEFDASDDEGWEQWMHAFREVWGDRGYLLTSLHRGVDDQAKLHRLASLSKRSRVPLLASGDVLYHHPERSILHDCLQAIAAGGTIDAIREQRLANAQHGIRSRKEIGEIYRDYPDAIARTNEVADRICFSLDELRFEYPIELAPEGMRPIDYLKQLTWKGAKQRYSNQVPAKVIDLLRHEIQLIEELQYEDYFLTVWDLVRFARSRDILCQGRGSAANSIVCFCLGVTSVDPAQMDLLFERFISKERNEAPDIDVDFEHQRREEVLQYIYQKYGRTRAAMTATVITYRIRSAVRECGKALGISLDRIDALSKILDGRSSDDGLAERCLKVGLAPTSELGKRFLYLVEHLVGFPRHLSQHVGGMVMTQGPICELCPVENAAMEGRTVIQWDKNDLDDLGILKVDCLSLGMLSAIRRSFHLIEHHYGRTLTLATVPQEDPQVYDQICKADTVGVFQIESRAQMSMLPRLKPRTFYDLVIEVAIVRPGPIQGQMVHPYLKARQTGVQPSYPTDAIRQVLEKTMGVPIFQEQAMRLAVVAAGFTPGEADQLRRAMAAFRRPGIIDQFRTKLILGMKANGLDETFAERVFTQIRGFGEYGFPESHAASFALLVYVSAYIKHYYPAAFCASILNSLPMGFYGPSQLIQDAQRHGVEVRAVDVNRSDWESTLEPVSKSVAPSKSFAHGSDSSNATALRLGLHRVRGLPESVGQTIVDARIYGGPYRDQSDLVRRTQLGQAMIAKLADSGALDTLSGNRRAALWQSMAQEKKSSADFRLFEFGGVDQDEDIPEALKKMSPIEEVYADYQTLGISLRGHPMDFCRKQLDAMRVLKAEDLSTIATGRFVRVAGLVVLRQRPSTAKGITFVTLEDETGSINLVIRPNTWKEFYMVCKQSNAWLIDGILESRENVIHVIVGRVHDLSEKVAGLNIRSRDFK